MTGHSLTNRQRDIYSGYSEVGIWSDRRDRHGRIHLIRADGTVIKSLGARDPAWEPDDPIVQILELPAA